MIKNIAIVGMILVLTACGSKKAAVENSDETMTPKESKDVVLGKSQAISYKSLGNGVASISLELYENNTFLFDFKSIPQPESNEKPARISEKGTYTSDGNWKTLYFKNPKFSVDAIFDQNYAGSADFNVIDDKSVKINTSKNSLNIWGVVCEKQ
ncbi:hypothetical protein [Aequorivita echinoideorum]|uniref:Lipoprotein n=1 Tax=Aequorivita echinoideorum TaxID=1549647 RepID=A0ABS5S4R3_9FLAO|nr:hypothetical protein [Aequorivita echinoideorum]MBT0608210.1 hypothetical protein [Aequorivita echinoideorum]